MKRCRICGGTKGDLIHIVGRQHPGQPGHIFKPETKTLKYKKV